MPPTPHYLSPSELVLAVDFARGWVLVGELARHYLPETVCRHFRWRLVDGEWECDRPGRDANPRPPIEDGDHHWRRNVRRSSLLEVQYEPGYVVIPRTELVRALDSLRKLTGKSLGVDGLVSVGVRADGLRLCTHGDKRMTAEVKSSVDGPARDGLGTVVVLGEALRSSVKNVVGHTIKDTVQVAVEWQAGHGRSIPSLRIHGASCWTVNIDHVLVDVPKRELVDLGLTGAITRALVFGGTDPTRPNLNCVLLDGQIDHVNVCATDGHRLYRERVETPSTVVALGASKHLLARGVLTSLRPTKRSGPYRFAFGGDTIVVASDDRTITCAPYEHTFPPYGQLIPRGLTTGEHDWSCVVLSAESIARMREWTQKQVTADRRKDDGNHYPVQLTFSNEGRTLKLDCAGADDITEECVEVVSPPRCKGWHILPVYWLEALDSRKDQNATHLAVGGEVDPIYLFDSHRVVLTMPMRW